MLKRPLTCWTLNNGFAAYRKQTNGIARALNLSFEEKTCVIDKPWSFLPANISQHIPYIIKRGKLPISPPWPNILICSGRKTIPIALHIKKQSQQPIFIIYVQKPYVKKNSFDCIICPEHDNISGENIITTNGAIHDLNQERLLESKKNTCHLAKQYGENILTILLGGTNKHYTLTMQRTQMLIETLKKVADIHQGNILISTSRRTGERNHQLIQESLKKHHKITVIDQHSSISYASLLAHAEHIMVSDDSISMISEACTTGKPVHLITLPESKQKKQKNQNFIKNLKRLGYIRQFDNTLPKWQYKPLIETTRIAEALTQRIKKKLNLS